MKMTLPFMCLGLTLGCSSAPVSPVTPPSPSTNESAVVEPDRIAGALMANRQTFRECYEKTATRKSGRLLVDFEIGLDGRVTSAKMKETTLNLPQVEACVLKTVRATRFPASKDVVTVSYPFKFEPR